MAFTNAPAVPIPSPKTGILRSDERQKVGSQTQPTPGNSMGGRDPVAQQGSGIGVPPSVQATAQGLGETAAGIANASAAFTKGNGPLIAAVIFVVATIWLVRNLT